MILPHPESDLSLNIMVLGASIVHLLKGRDFVLVEDALESFVRRGEKRTPDMFLNTITFLYSCGLIEKKGYKIKLVSHQKIQMELL